MAGRQVGAAAGLLTLLAALPAATPPKTHGKPEAIFQTSDRCMACHNGLATSTGEDVSIGLNWRATMMANSSRDPYWQAGVRRETLDHPESRAAIEDECAVCHMPMARYQAMVHGREGEVFAHLPFDAGKPEDRLAADGVSCSTCHQIKDEKLGTRESFVGRFVIDTTTVERSIYGPFEVDPGRTRVMRSSSGFRPTEAKHLRQSEICATCHTLLTKALGPGGQVIGELPEQVPYQEWLHSSFRGEKSCQACHMPAVTEEMPISAVLGKPRADLGRHTFTGGNFFMLRVLNRFRNELSVEALPQEMDAAATRTVAHLQAEAARLTIERAERRGGRLEAEIAVENLGGHKLPTAYPSRRVWLHVVVRDAARRTVFESGALTPQGRIQGNDNDADPARFEPHYSEITSADQVQIYESVMGDRAGVPTTGLLTAVRFLKDNRLLPHGFDKRTAGPDIAVQGGAAEDADFTAGGDRVRYAVAVDAAEGPLHVEAELWYQPISYRWAENLRPYQAMETQRFVKYYEAMSRGSGVVLARASATAR